VKKLRQIIISLPILLIFSCTSKKSFHSAADKIKFYESRARTYKALASSQILIPPYGKNSQQSLKGLYDPTLRVVYLQEAKRYEKLAEEIKVKQKKD
jgi:hypothetical protein